MPKGYWIVHVSVNDAENYPTYVAAATSAIQKYEGKFLTRGGEAQLREGSLGARHVIIEFSSYARAIECYDSPEYATALNLRKRFADSNMVIVEGAE